MALVIDVLIATAAKGGVENIIKMMIEDIEGPDVSFRVVQLVWEGEKWLPEGVPYYPLLEGKGEYTLESFVEAYRCFIISHGIPDIILATVWPYTINVARNALIRIRSMKHYTKVISWMHHDIDEYKKSYEQIEEWLGMADGHLAINHNNHKTLRELFPDKPIYRLRNPINIPDAINIKNALEGRRRDCRKTLKLGFVGRISEEKNIEILLTAVSKLKDCELVVIGTAEDFSYQDRLKELTEALDITNRVSWMGWQQDPWSCVIDKGVDAICLTSYYEGFPLAALESLANGIPVIASRTTGIKEIIKEGITGYTFDVGDEKQLIDLLNTLIEEGVNIQSEDCIKEAQIYERHTTLWDMSIKLAALALEEDLIPDSVDHPWFADEQLVKDKISVIVTCYNAEKSVTDCLESIINQSLHVADWDIVCVDDASTDGTLDVLRKYEQNHEDKLILISLPENVGQEEARNIGLSYADGNYVTFVDSGNVLLPDRLDKMYRNMIKFGENDEIRKK